MPRLAAVLGPVPKDRTGSEPSILDPFELTANMAAQRAPLTFPQAALAFVSDVSADDLSFDPV
jgi:hypothetical protein